MPLNDERDFWHHTDNNKSRVYKCRVNIGKLWRKIWRPKRSEIEEKFKQKKEQADWESIDLSNKDLLKNDLIERLCKELKVREHEGVKL